jgi:hypothetical protein
MAYAKAIYGKGQLRFRVNMRYSLRKAMVISHVLANQNGKRAGSGLIHNLDLKEIYSLSWRMDSTDTF